MGQTVFSSKRKRAELCSLRVGVTATAAAADQVYRLAPQTLDHGTAGMPLVAAAVRYIR